MIRTSSHRVPVFFFFEGVAWLWENNLPPPISLNKHPMHMCIPPVALHISTTYAHVAGFENTLRMKCPTKSLEHHLQISFFLKPGSLVSLAAACCVFFFFFWTGATLRIEPQL